MTDYTQSKIYKIYSLLGDKVYIGSTTLQLCARMATHRTNYRAYKMGRSHKYCSSCDLFNEYGLSNCYIELIEKKECANKNELCQIEEHYRKLYTTAVNQKRAYRTIAERKIYHNTYMKTPKYKAYMRTYSKNPKYKSYMRTYIKSPKFKSYQKTYYVNNQKNKNFKAKYTITSDLSKLTNKVNIHTKLSKKINKHFKSICDSISLFFR